VASHGSLGPLAVDEGSMGVAKFSLTPAAQTLSIFHFASRIFDQARAYYSPLLRAIKSRIERRNPTCN